MVRRYSFTIQPDIVVFKFTHNNNLILEAGRIIIALEFLNSEY
jgi:hypothetical protein